MDETLVIANNSVGGRGSPLSLITWVILHLRLIALDANLGLVLWVTGGGAGECVAE